jgi:uncharacterized repeat protein (TIGR03803 family)
MVNVPTNVNSPDLERFGQPGGSSAVGLFACLCAALATVPAHLTASESVLYNFATSSLQGSNPYAGLLRDKAGVLYGTTVSGGASGDGTVYRIGANGGETVLYSFTGPDGANPYGGVIADDQGNLYGTTYGGGASGAGVVFKLDRSGVETVLYSFTGGADGGNPHGGVVRDAQGNLYGTTEYGGISCLPNNPFGPPTPPCGVVFKLDTAGNETVLYSFVIGSGVNPPSGLTMDAAGNFYGVSQDDGGSYGYIFKVDAAGQFSVFYEFASIIGPMSPFAAPTPDGAGNLYGTTTAIFGGSGTVYKLSSAGVETTLLIFPGGIDSAQPYGSVVFDAEGNLYGTTYNTPSSFGPAGPGTVYKLTPGGTYTTLYGFSGGADGGHPTDTLVIDSAGNLYGTASTGGEANAGVVFKVDLSGAETVLYSFLEAPGGTTPSGPVTRVGSGELFGTTSAGGAYGAGTVYWTDAAGAPTVLYSFTGGADGGNPQSGVIGDSTGNLYGTTAGGGVSNNGVVYKIDRTGTETVLYSFLGGSDGFAPYGRLTKDAAGNLYGTTTGSDSGGTVYQIDPAGNKTILHNFDGADGQAPYSGVTLDPSGNIYGTTTLAGSTDSGTVYKLSSSGEELLVYSFLGATDGSDPYAGVILDSAGNLYGTTVYGGTEGAGTVYKLDPKFNKTALYNFTGGSDGANPYASLLRSKAGNLYAMTQNGGANGKGVVFELDAAGKETVLYSFSGTDGQAPVAGLIVDESGDLYGTTPSGGSKSGGVIFELKPGATR